MSFSALILTISIVAGQSAEIKDRIADLESMDATTVAEALNRLESIVALQEPGAESAKQALQDFKTQSCDFLQSVGNTERMLTERRSLTIVTKEQIPLFQMKSVLMRRDASEVRIKAPHFTDKHLEFLVPFKRLMFLEIQEAEVAGKSFGQLDLSQVIWLKCQNCPLDEQCLCEAALPALRLLDLRGSTVSDYFMEEASFLKLEFLNIQDTEISREGVPLLRRFPKLKVAKLNYSVISPAFIDGVADEEYAMETIELLCDDDELAAESGLLRDLREKCVLQMKRRK